MKGCRWAWVRGCCPQLDAASLPGQAVWLGRPLVLHWSELRPVTALRPLSSLCPGGSHRLLGKGVGQRSWGRPIAYSGDSHHCWPQREGTRQSWSFPTRSFPWPPPPSEGTPLCYLAGLWSRLVLCLLLRKAMPSGHGWWLLWLPNLLRPVLGTGRLPAPHTALWLGWIPGSQDHQLQFFANELP